MPEEYEFRPPSNVFTWLVRHLRLLQDAGILPKTKGQRILAVKVIVEKD